MAHYDNYSRRGRPTKLMVELIRQDHEHIIQKIQRFSQKKERIKILELGGGKGEFAQEISRQENIAYYSIEPNKTLAKNLERYGKVHVSTVPPIPFNEKFDVIFSSNVIEHVPSTEVGDFVASSVGSLRNNGLLIIKFPNYLDFREMFWDCDHTHLFPTTENRIRQLLSDNGLVIEEIEYSRLSFRGFARVFIAKLNRILRPLVKYLRIPYQYKIYKLYLSTSEQITVYARKTIAE